MAPKPSAAAIAMAGKKFSSCNLIAAIREETDPDAALRIFLNPPSARPSSQFRHCLRCYDLIISKLAAARLFPAVESILSRLPPSDASHGTGPRENLLCRVISAYGRARLPAAARRAFEHPAFPDPRTAHALNTLLNALLDCRSPLPDLLSVCRDAGSSSGSLERTRQLFDEMLSLGIAPTADTFGTLVAALCDAGQLKEAFEVKDAMVTRYDVPPSARVYASLIKGLCQRGDVDAAVRLKDEMAGKAELMQNSAGYGALVRALFRAGRKGEAHGLLEELKGRGIVPHRDRVVYNAMIAGFCEDERDPNAAFAVLDDMEKCGCKPNTVTYDTLVMGLCKLGRWRDAIKLVEEMPSRGCRPDVVTYRMLFDGLCAAGEFHEANRVLGEMVAKGFAPSKDGARKFVEGIEKEGDPKLLESRKVVSVLAMPSCFGMEHPRV
ncbi:hypothetical protein HU200_020099 [Digitaria exilis]|uniref:PROP1-like PPR domain-containing protein n=1 Tax=Digitaria exilis TaxID=1010633 RepID=A0A835F1A0_9POAL|nr:hypothetical protein HU200_020099 [Digitaria exilis]CAB3463543.1 unnamed protein product [Digitaria exilis]